MKYIPLVSLFLFISCSTNSYKKYSSGVGGRTGYKNSKISKTKHTVFYQVNGNETHDYAYRMFLRRCAEIARDNNYSHFIISKENSGSFLNGIVKWPNHSGEIKLTNKKTENSYSSKEILSSYLLEKQ